MISQSLHNKKQTIDEMNLRRRFSRQFCHGDERPKETYCDTLTEGREEDGAEMAEKIWLKKIKLKRA
jgi:hypothetical protein